MSEWSYIPAPPTCLHDAHRGTFTFTFTCTILKPKSYYSLNTINPLNAELNPICHLLALLGAHHIFHVSRLRVNRFVFLTQSHRTVSYGRRSKGIFKHYFNERHFLRTTQPSANPPCWSGEFNWSALSAVTRSNFRLKSASTFTLTGLIPLCLWLSKNMQITANHILYCYYSDTFRLVPVIIRLSFEPCFRCTINSAHFGFPKVYMVLVYCYHVYPTIVERLL